MINVHREPSSRGQVDLIEYKEGADKLDFVNRILEPSRNSSWLNLNPRVPSKDISQPPSKKKEAQKNRIGTSNCYTKTSQQGRGMGQVRGMSQMAKARKKDWYTDIAYIRNVFAFIAVRINPLRIEAKIDMFAHQNLCQWIYFLWDTMILHALQDFIKTNQTRTKLEWDIKENTVLNFDTRLS